MNEAAGPTTVSQDLLAAAVGALMPLGAGILTLIGYLWLSFFGAVLGAAGAVVWFVWWRKKHGRFFPTDLPGSTVVRLALLVGGLALVFAVSM
jgi:hypothetical protein